MPEPSHPLLSPLRVPLGIVLAAALLSASPAAARISVSGQVLTAEGEPLAGAPVTLHRTLPTREWGTLRLEGEILPETLDSAVTGEDGSFRVEAPGSGFFWVTVRPEGRVARSRVLAPLLVDRVLPPVRLDPDAGLRVEVLGPGGAPVPGAWVRADPTERERGREWSRSGRLARTPAAETSASAARGTRGAGPGVARLVRAPGETLALTAWAPGFAESEPVEISDGHAVVRLAPSEEQALEVTDAAGRPAAGAVLRLGRRSWPVAELDERGRAVVALPSEGDFTFSLDAVSGWSAGGTLRNEPGGAGDEQRAGSGDGAAAEAERLRLPRPSTIAGRVVTTDGSPVAGAFVWERGRGGDAIVTDRAGRFTLPTGSVGRTVVHAAALGLRQDAEWLDIPDLGSSLEAELRLGPAGSVLGRVVDEAGVPVAGARVRLRFARLERSWHAVGSFETRSDEAGRFRADGLDATALYTLRAEASGFAPEELEVEPRGAGEAREVTVELGRGGGVAGRVVDETGQPVAGAAVALVRADDGDEGRGPTPGAVPDFESESGEDGSFHVPRLPEARFHLRVASPGFAPLELPAFEVTEAGELVDLGDVELAPGARLEGVVRSARGVPVAAAAVVVHPVEAHDVHEMGMAWRGTIRHDEEPDAVTGEDGRFAVADLAAGFLYDVEVRAEGFAPAEVANVRVPPEDRLAIELAPAARVFGRVVDPAGRGVARSQLRLRLTRSDGSVFSSPLFKSWAETDGDGRFAVEDLPAGTLELTASDRGHPPETIPPIALVPGAEIGPIEVRLETGATLEGRVLGRGGAPVSARVHASSQPEGGAFHPGGFVPATRQVRSGTDGSFRLEGLPRGRIRVTARHEEEGEASREVELGDGGERVELVLEPLKSGFTGRVLRPDGRPAPGAVVRVRGESWSAGGSVDETGRFSFGSPAPGPGVYELTARHEGLAVRESVRLAEGESPPEVILTLREAAAVTGRLSGLEREELAEVVVRATSDEGRRTLTGRVGIDGEYRLEGLLAGVWEVTAVHAPSGRRARGRAEVPDQGETRLDLDLEVGLRLSGRVSVGGRPMTGGFVRVWGGELQAVSVVSAVSHDGRYEIGGLAAGSYGLTVSRRGGTPFHQERIELASDRVLDLDLEVAVVAGRVVAADRGEPLAGATLSFEGEGDGRRGMAQARSGADGRFRLDPVTPGGGRLVVRAEGYVVRTVPLDVPPGGLPDVEILLERGEGVLVRARTADGAVPRMLSVRVSAPDGRLLLHETLGPDAAGGFRLPGLDPGVWRLWVVGVMEGVTATAPWSGSLLVPGPPVEVVLEPATRLTLRVPALEGGWTPAHVRLVDAAGTPFELPRRAARMQGLPLSNGVLEVRMLPAGTWTATVTAADGRIWSGTVTTAPGAPVELVLE